MRFDRAALGEVMAAVQVDDIGPRAGDPAMAPDTQAVDAGSPMVLLATYDGTPGGDTYTGTSDGDVINGNGGNDTLAGAGGADTIDGGDGDDKLYAGALSPGYSRPYGNGGYIAPVMDTGTDVDTMTGGDGNDTIFAGYGDNADGGIGSGDGLLLSFQGATAGVTVSFAAFGTAPMTIGGGTIRNIEHLLWVDGSNFADTITGPDDGGDFTPLFGLGGDDHLTAGRFGTGNMYGGDGDDTIDASRNAYSMNVYGDAGNDTIIGGSAKVFGGDGDDIITGGSKVDGGDGNDTITVGTADPAYGFFGGAGDDHIIGASSNDVLVGGSGADLIEGGDGNDTLRSAGIDDEDLLDTGSEHDTLVGGAGNDDLGIGYGDDADGGEGTDRVYITMSGATSGVTIDLSDLINGTTIGGGVIKNIEVLGSVGGTAFDDTIRIGNFQASVLVAGGGGNDHLTATTTSVSFLGGTGDDVLIGGSAADSLDGGIGNDILRGGDGDDVINGSDGDDLIEGGLGNDQIRGGSGSDTVSYEHATGGMTFGVSGTGGVTTAHGPDGDEYLYDIENAIGSGFADTITGSYMANRIDGGAGDDILDGGEGDDLLLGGMGNDSITGGVGADTMQGGTGDDSYFVDNAGDRVIEANGEGNDTVTSSVNFSAAGQSIEVVTLSGSANIDATGNELDNRVTGNGGNNRLDGAGGNDVLNGMAGNDTLVGGAGNDRLDGGIGLDAMSGGTGDDTYVVDNAGDTVTENASDGTDTVETGLNNYVLGTNIENLTLTGTADLNGTGNAGNNVLTGNAGANRLDGAAGADTMAGGAGNDTYVVDDAGDVVIEQAGEGNDTVQASVSYTLGANVENLVLTGTGATNGTGNAGGNVLTGNSGANRLDGGAGADTMAGGLGNDTYIVDDAGDVVIEQAGEGTDTVKASISYTLAANIENLTLTGTAGIDATGNTGSNVLIGNSGDNRLDGGAGSDAMYGGAGNDTYIVDNAVDVVVEYADAGIDTVLSSVGFTLGADVENLTLTGAADLDGTGNAGANVIIGNNGANRLTGGGGNDTISGGAGSDTLDGGDGDDIVDGGDNDDLIYGSLGVDSLSGGGGNDTFRFQAVQVGGSPTAIGLIDGGSGDDTLDFRTISPVILGTIEASPGNYVLGAYVGSQRYEIRNVEHILFGDTADSISLPPGFAGPIELRAGGGDDSLMVGGVGDFYGEAGDDSFFLSGHFGGAAVGGIVDGGTGTDTLKLNIAFTVDLAAGTATSGNASYAVAGFEHVSAAAWLGYVTTVSGSDANEVFDVNPLFNDGSVGVVFDGRGGDDLLTGSAGNDMLNGGTGADRMTGGAGNDTYVVDSAGDVVTENADEGTDTVQSAVSYSLGANIENLTLTGSADIDGAGNAGNNVIIGNSGSNRLNGGGGTDTLIGGAGDDVYVIDSADDVVVELGNEGDDTVKTSVDYVLAAGASVENLRATGTANLAITGNVDRQILVGNAGASVLDAGGAGAFDRMKGGYGNDTYIVRNAGDVVVEFSDSGTNDTVKAAVSYTLGADAWVETLQTIDATATTALNLTGNDHTASITGNAGANVLTGGAGGETLAGLGGDDTLYGGGGADVFVFASGTGHDTIGDFTHGSDVIDLSAAGFISFAQVQAASHDDGSGAAVIDLGGGSSVTVTGVASAALQSSDFRLGSGGAAIGTAAVVAIPTASAGDTGDMVFDAIHGQHLAEVVGPTAPATWDLL